MTRRTLSFKENFDLMKLIETAYVSSGKSDTEFAAYANETLGITKINRDHIEQRRPVFGIPSNNPRKLVSAVSFDAIAALEKRVTALETALHMQALLGKK